MSRLKKLNSAGGTHAKLLKAASELFAVNGFRSTTTRAIAGRAGVNIASLHYHFRNKEGIYKAVFESSVDAILAKFPVERGWRPGDNPEERLSAIIDSSLRRILHEDKSDFWKLFMREMIDPGLGREVLFKRIAQPQFESLRGTVSALLGASAPKEAILLCSMSVASQILFHRFARPMIGRLLPEHAYDEPVIAKLSAFIAKSCISFIKSYGRELSHGKA